MQCPECTSTHIRKNGKKRGKQNHICVDCGRQFIDCYNPPKGYSNEFKRDCLKLYVNGSGFRAIERVKGVHHTTVIDWVKQVGQTLPHAYEAETWWLSGIVSSMLPMVIGSILCLSRTKITRLKNSCDRVFAGAIAFLYTRQYNFICRC